MITPSSINLSKDRKTLTIKFDSVDYSLSTEFLRVQSPSAEVLGHGPGQEILQLNKENVAITKIRPVGNYAIAIHYSDGHNSGIYSWSYLHYIALNQKKLWREYNQKKINSTSNSVGSITSSRSTLNRAGEEIILFEEDFEDDNHGWSLDAGWELTTSSYNSGTQSILSPNNDSNKNGKFALISPEYDLPSLEIDSTMHFGFFLYANFPR